MLNHECDCEVPWQCINCLRIERNTFCEENNQLHQQCSAIINNAHLLVKDYPWETNDAIEAYFAVAESLEGTRLANEDLHKFIDKINEVHNVTKEEYIEILVNAIKTYRC